MTVVPEAAGRHGEEGGAVLDLVDVGEYLVTQA